jgi:hypothetical protein
MIAALSHGIGSQQPRDRLPAEIERDVSPNTQLDPGNEQVSTGAHELG